MDSYWDCIFFLFNSLLGLDITSPCLLGLLSCFSPQLVSDLLPLLFFSLITLDFYHMHYNAESRVKLAN